MLKKVMTALLALCLLLGTTALAEEGAATGPVFFADFDAEDLNGDKNVTEEVFKDSYITLVNFWATWCGPCISELPDLAKISEATGGKVQVVGVLTDAMDLGGARDEAAIEAMKLLLEDAGVEYPVLYPDGFLANLSGILEYIPTTFIIDNKGQYHEMAVGSKSLEDWIAAAQAVADVAYEDDITLAE